MKETKKSPNKIDAKESDYLYIHLSQLPASGNGLLTCVDIYKDEIIAIFKGEILESSQAKIRADKNKDQYFIKMLNGSIMDSRKTKCFAKYANDANGYSNNSGGFKNNAKIALDDFNNICLIATRFIKTGEEIFCSYGKSYWEKHADVKHLILPQSLTEVF